MRYSEFLLVFEMKAFKVGCFAFFVTPIFQSIPVLNGLSKNIAFAQKWKIAIFESCCSFPKEIDKNKQIQNLFWLIINSLSKASRWPRQRGL